MRLRSRSVLAVALLAAGACASAGGPRSPLPTRGDTWFVAGYHPYWTGDTWQSYPWDALDRIYFFEVEAGPDGGLEDRHGWPGEWLPLIRRAQSEGVDIVPTLSMHGADGFEELFASPERVERLVEETVALLQATPGLGGLHLDFEVFQPVDVRVRDGYTAFVARLRRRMAEVDPTYTLSAFALAFDDDDVYSERVLAELTDYLVVQGYDYHSAGEPNTGPLAPLSGWGRLNWSYVVDRFLALGVPARKIVMAVPMYGYEWPTDTGEPGSTTRGQGVEIVLAPPPGIVPELIRAPVVADRTGLRRDPESGVPYYAYRDQSGWRQGWFEDRESLRAKYRFVREHGLGGVAIFPLAYGDSALWADLRDAFRLPRGAPRPDTPM
ncbi:MAG: glycosyl hydrolase family 18 protein [Gemmatimonadota bacterium]